MHFLYNFKNGLIAKEYRNHYKMAVVKYLIHNVTKSSVLDPRSTVRSAFSWICVRVFLGLAGESVNEAHVGEHAIFIFGITELSEQLLDILLGDFISKVAEDVVKLSKHHGAVAVFVVELEELNIVVVDPWESGVATAALTFSTTSSYLANFLPSSSVCPWATQAFLVMFRPRAYMTSPRKKRSISPLPSQS